MSDDVSVRTKTVKELASVFGATVKPKGEVPMGPRQTGPKRSLPQPQVVAQQQPITPPVRPLPKPKGPVLPQGGVQPIPVQPQIVQPVPVQPQGGQPQPVQPQVLQPIPVQPQPVQAQPRPLGKVALQKKQAEEKAKHECLTMIAEGIQSTKTLTKLKFLTDDMTPLQKTVKVNMALAGHVEGVTAKDVVKILAPNANDGAAKAVMQEFATMPKIDLSVDVEKVEAAIQVFSKFTKEGYENVTGVARGGTRYDKGLKGDRKMTKEEMEDGAKTLKGLIDNWPTMPKFPGSTVYRVMHTGTGEDAAPLNGTVTKVNPTSTSVATDWSRVADGKVCAKITIVPSTDERRPVDTRGVSTYAHEGEILLPPNTVFKKTGVDGNFTTFDANMP